MSKRTEQVGDLVRDLVSKEIIGGQIEFPPNCLVTVTRCEVTPDLDGAKVFVSVFPDELSDEALEILYHAGRSIQENVFHKMFAKKVPSLEFVADHDQQVDEEVDKWLE